MADVALPPKHFLDSFDVIIVGGGGTGLTAALAASDRGTNPVVFERDSALLGSTAMSTGLIPAAGTPEQIAAGIDDSPARFVEDILHKTKGLADRALAELLARESADTIAWFRDEHHVSLTLMDGWQYPAHSVRRMYGMPHRTGGELMAALEAAAVSADVPVLTDATVDRLYIDGDRVAGVRVRRPDGSTGDYGCTALILACSGFGGNPELVAEHIPEMAGAVYHGHPGNRGDAIRRGEAIGAQIGDLDAYQGHGGLAVGHGVPILWPLIMEGGIQVNLMGQRFSNEAAGYSEQAAIVNAQPDRVAWLVYDGRCHRLMLEFDDYQDALRAGAVIEAEDAETLARHCTLPVEALERSLAEAAAATQSGAADRFGRRFASRPELKPPYFAPRVTGAIFHTQGGLAIDDQARVRRRSGGMFANLYAGGGAARGVSGRGASGYLAGNGLLAATTLGKIAGRAASAPTVEFNSNAR